VADDADTSESLVSAAAAADVSTVGKHSRVLSSQDDADEPACSMEDVIQLLQLLSAIASDTQSTGLIHCFLCASVAQVAFAFSILTKMVFWLSVMKGFWLVIRDAPAVPKNFQEGPFGDPPT